jgi:hypothetical protein
MDKNDQFLAKTFDNFLSSSEISSLMEYVTTMNEWRHIPNSFWDNRVIGLAEIKDPDIFDTVKNIGLRIQDTIVANYNTTNIPYPDTIDLVRWYSGMSQNPHCDNMSDTPGQDVIHGHRSFGCVIYLNDNYGGGHTYYPNHNFSIKPKAGTLAVHLGDCNHRHGVTQIENNTRYTLASFWTFDKNRALKCISWN